MEEKMNLEAEKCYGKQQRLPMHCAQKVGGFARAAINDLLKYKFWAHEL